MDMMDILLSRQLNGGGTTVVPNPEEIPTDTLNTIGINNIVYSVGNSGVSYSTAEKPIGTWIDNSTLYRMVIEVQDPTVTKDNIDLQFNVTNLITAYGMTYNLSTELFETVYSSDKNHIGIIRGVLSFNTAEDRIWKYIIIEYTKSSEPINPAIRNWDFTDSLIDTVIGAPAQLGRCSRSDKGIYMSASNAYISFSNLIDTNRTYEIDFGDCNMVKGSSHARVFMYSSDEGFIYRSSGKWAVYFGDWEESSITDINYFANSTLKIEITSDKKWKIYKDNQLVFSPNSTMRGNSPLKASIGSSNAQSYYNATIKAFRVSVS